MNYYIQGDAANADKIRAAFEKLCIDVLDFGFADKTVVYCSIGGCVQPLPYSINLMHILYSHHDYKELELPVEHKFKVGDWIINRFRDICLIIDIDLENEYYFCGSNRFGNTYGDIDLTDETFHLWSIQDAKDGDVLVYQDEIFLFNLVDNNSVLYHCCFDGELVVHSFYAFSNEDLLHVHPATKEQRDLLFRKMKEAGYQWDVDKKELRKIKPHYNIANFQPKQWVLVRQGDGCAWRLDIFSNLKEGTVCQFECVGNNMVQCVPFNDDTKHLLGTTDMPDERFINW